MLDYGEDLRLCTYHHCQMLDDINLLPYPIFEIEGYGTFAIDKQQQVTPNANRWGGLNYLSDN